MNTWGLQAPILQLAYTRGSPYGHSLPTDNQMSPDLAEFQKTPQLASVFIVEPWAPGTLEKLQRDSRKIVSPLFHLSLPERQLSLGSCLFVSSPRAQLVEDVSGIMSLQRRGRSFYYHLTE